MVTDKNVEFLDVYEEFLIEEAKKGISIRKIKEMLQEAGTFTNNTYIFKWYMIRGGKESLRDLEKYPYRSESDLAIIHSEKDFIEKNMYKSSTELAVQISLRNNRNISGGLVKYWMSKNYIYKQEYMLKEFNVLKMYGDHRHK